MSTELKKTETSEPQSALAAMATRLQVSQTRLMETLKSTVFKKCTNEEFTALVIVAQTYDLNPLLKEMYAFPAKGGGIVPVVGVDGWLKIINSRPEFNGMDVTLSPDGEEATCKIYVKGREHPTVVTEYLSECKRPTEPWKTMPKRMLRNKVIIQAGRVAFGISGIQDEDEAKDSVRNITPSSPEVRATPIDPFDGQPKAEKVVEVKSEPVAEAEVVVEPEPEKPVIATDKPMEFIDRETPPTYPEGTEERNGMVLNVDMVTGDKTTMYVCKIEVNEKVIEALTFSSRVGNNALVMTDKSSRVFLRVGEDKKIQLIDVQPFEATTSLPL